MLGTTKIRGDSEGMAMVKSMQELILATLFAQTQLEAKEKAAKLTQAKVKASQSRRRSSRAKKTSRTKSKKPLQLAD
jgi:hypothetical protein